MNPHNEHLADLHAEIQQLKAQNTALRDALQALDDVINEPGGHEDWTDAVIKASDNARQAIAL